MTIDGNGSNEPSPILVLVKPEIPENLGFIARTMQCFGWNQWRIVGRDPKLFDSTSPAWKTASGAETLFAQCQYMPSLEAAVSDCHEVWGFSRRAHGDASIENLVAAVSRLGQKPSLNRLAWVFGPESQGLSGHEAAMIQRWIRIETPHPTMSLNLSHAVALAMHAWQTRYSKPESESEAFQMGDRGIAAIPRAPHGLLEKGWDILQTAIHLQQVFPQTKEAAQLQYLRTLWNRIAVNQGEGEFLVGLLKVLLQGRQPRPSKKIIP
jgi:tRNA/rRNA methyltransferase